MEETIEQLESIWRSFNPHVPFSWYFLDKRFEWSSEFEKRTGNLLAITSVLTIILACIGLFGGVAYHAEQQTRQMAIRKILGASMFHLIIHSMKKNVPLFIVSIILSWPLSYVLSKAWLDRFAYHISLDFSFFLVASVITLLVTALTMVHRAIQSALKHLVAAIMYE